MYSLINVCGVYSKYFVCPEKIIMYYLDWNYFKFMWHLNLLQEVMWNMDIGRA